MRLLGSAVALLLFSCRSEPAQMPDAAIQHGVHDIAPTPCDIAWNPSGAQLQFCETACQVRPADAPCNGKTPCSDGPSCANARDVTNVKDCPSTFVASDFMGQHRGCCLIRVETSAMVPAFYECPAG